MSLILDASVTLARVFHDERTQAVDQVFDLVVIQRAWVPELWRIEVANTLNIGVRRNRIDVAKRQRIFADLMRLPIDLDLDSSRHSWTDTLLLADSHSLTMYDATYLELAKRLSLPLATLDRQLRTAAQAESIPLLGL